MKTQSYDLIGDIHGHHTKLVDLLTGLGYRERGAFAGWTHPEGRKVIFLGDYIDRGPKIREVLHEVRAMVEAGDALAIMGNHEFSAILHEAAGEAPSKASADLRGTLAQFAGIEEEWADHASWLRHLPVFLDLGALRAVHACWDDRAIRDLGGNPSFTPGLFEACPALGNRERKAVDRLLSGPEFPVPDDALVLNSKGMPLPKIRVRWWNLPDSRYPIGDLALPESLGGRGLIEPGTLAGLPNYPPGDPPVFFGHYWLPADRRKAPLTANLVCLDYSAGRGEPPLVAYRWDGEAVLSDSKFFTPDPLPHD